MTAGAGQRAGGAAERGDHAAVVVAAEQLPGQPCRLAQRLGVAEPFGLGVQLGQLAGADLGLRDLLQLVAQQLGLAFVLAGLGLELVQLAADLPQAAPAGGEVGAQGEHVAAGELVEQVALDGRAQQPLELVLAVHLDQGADHLGDSGDGGHAALQLGAAAPLDEHLPGHDHLPVLVVGAAGPQRLDRLALAVQAEPALHQGGRLAGPHRPDVGTLAEQ